MQSPILDSFQISTPSGELEVTACIPSPPVVNQPLLFVHGAHCSAACFNNILPQFARTGYACYALSLRGHGKSWQPGVFAFHALTGLDAYAADVEAALAFLTTQHVDTAPVLLGHSMGGAVLQYMLARWEMRSTRPSIAIAGLVLLASAPLSGGALDVARNWQAAEKALAKGQASVAGTTTYLSRLPAPAKSQGWLPWLGSFFALDFRIPTGVETPAQVRSKFFSVDATDDVVHTWMRDSQSRMESIRVSLELCWPVGTPGAVLAAIAHDKPPAGRKLLCISAGKDVLITKAVSQDNFDTYSSVCQGEMEVLRASLLESAHHVMMDIGRERCADIIISWLQGKLL